MFVELHHGLLLNLAPVPILTVVSQLKRKNGDSRLIVAKVLKKTEF
jgi:hypothetical protein